MHTLLQEIKQFGEFSSQFYALESFRQELKPFYQWKLLYQKAWNEVLL